MSHHQRRIPVVVNGRNVAEVASDPGRIVPLVFIHLGDMSWNLTPDEARALAGALRESAEDAPK